MTKKLTVVITTYNRRDRLIRQLKSLYRQPLYSYLHIVICDNSSDYDVDQVLNESFLEEELSHIEVIKNPYNIGMIGNISNAFLFSKTKWMWLLSDDDETTVDSISTIIKYSELFPEVLALKFTEISKSTVRKYEVGDVKSIDGLLNFCRSNNVDLGNFIFMSNNVYNMELARPFLGYAFIHSYTYFPHIIPILMGLNKARSLKFISESVVTYKIPDVESSSDYLVSIYLGAMTIADIPLDLSKDDYRNLINFFKMNVFWEISSDFYKSNYVHKRYLYRKIYKVLFSDNWSIKNIIIYRLFDYQIQIGSDSISKFCFMLKEKIRNYKI